MKAEPQSSGAFQQLTDGTCSWETCEVAGCRQERFKPALAQLGGWSSEAEPLPSRHRVLGSIPSTTEEVQL